MHRYDPAISECRDNLEKLIKVEACQKESIEALKSQEASFTQEKAKLVNEKQSLEENRRANLEELQTSRDETRQLKEALVDAEARYRTTLLELGMTIATCGPYIDVDSEFGDYKTGICRIISDFSVQLGCKKATIFGEKSVDSIGVVLDELCAEHQAKYRIFLEESRSKIDGLQKDCVQISASLEQERSLV